MLYMLGVHKSVHEVVTPGLPCCENSYYFGTIVVQTHNSKHGMEAEIVSLSCAPIPIRLQPGYLSKECGSQCVGDYFL